MAPFSSKYDDYLRHTATLTPLEMRGLGLFKNPDKGACSACHRFEDSSNRPSRSMFTNYGYDALAVPRNPGIPANSDPNYHDLGLCERTAKVVASSAPNWCANFRTPSLRNVAVRKRFMHNGAFSKLRDVVAFYATRSTNPKLWYPPGAKFDDVPAKYRGNVNVSSLPYNRREGVEPAYGDEEVDAIVAFLQTLTDEPYRSASPAQP
jgi:cytochrome c peroxidase